MQNEILICECLTFNTEICLMDLAPTTNLHLAHMGLEIELYEVIINCLFFFKERGGFICSIFGLMPPSTVMKSKKHLQCC